MQDQTVFFLSSESIIAMFYLVLHFF